MSIRQNNGKNIGLGHFLETKTKMIAKLEKMNKSKFWVIIGDWSPKSKIGIFFT